MADAIALPQSRPAQPAIQFFRVIPGVLLLAAVGCWLRLWQERSRILPLVAGSLAVGFAVMVRPANLFMVFAWLVSCALVLVRQRPALPHLMARGLVIAVAVLLPSLPQLANNMRHYGQMSPLVVSDLGRSQQLWGVRYLKYGTAVNPLNQWCLDDGDRLTFSFTPP